MSEHLSAGLSSWEERVISCIQSDEVVECLQELVQRRSDFPPGDTRNVVDWACKKLSQANISYKPLSNQPHQVNLLAWMGDPQRKPVLTFHAHIDTVPPGDFSRWSADPFSGIVKDGRIYGRGTGDDKGSAAVQLMAFITLARAGVIPEQCCLQLALVADEESGALQGTHWLWKNGLLKPDFLVVGEQTNNCVAIAERVACGIDVIVHGKSSHGAMPWAGENAVLKAARALSYLQDHLFPLLQEQKRHPYLPPATLSIGKISGGIQWNIVPERCTIEMDRRLLPGETRESAMDEIRQVLDEFSSRVEPLRYELFSTGEIAANINMAPDHPFVLQAHRALNDVSTESRPLTGYVQTSDGRWFARDGIPIIIFGPGDPILGHSTDEWVSVDQMVEATRFYTLLALRWVKGQSLQS